MATKWPYVRQTIAAKRGSYGSDWICYRLDKLIGATGRDHNPTEGGDAEEVDRHFEFWYRPNKTDQSNGEGSRPNRKEK